MGSKFLYLWSLFHEATPHFDFNYSKLSTSRYTITIPTLTPDGSTVSMLKLKNPDPDQYAPLDPIKRLNMMYDLMLDQTIISSKNYLIYDYIDSTPAHVAKVNPLIVKTHLDTLVSGMTRHTSQIKIKTT